MFIFFKKQRLWYSYINPLAAILLLSMPLIVNANGQFKVATSSDQRVSLRANQASLKAIVEQISRELKIELQAKIGDNEKITVDFRNVPLESALKIISPNHITVKENKSGKIAKIFLLPQGQDAPRIITEPRPPSTPITTTPEGGQINNRNTATSEPINREQTVISNQDATEENPAENEDQTVTSNQDATDENQPDNQTPDKSRNMQLPSENLDTEKENNEN